MKRARRLSLALLVASSPLAAQTVHRPIMHQQGDVPVAPQAADALGGVPMDAGYGGGPGYGGPMYGGEYAGGPGCYGGECGPGGFTGTDDELWNKVHQPNRWYFGVNYAGLSLDGMFLPALATTSPAGTAQAVAGRLPGATVLIGNEEVGEEWRHGGEIRLGWWLVDGQFLALEGFYMGTETEETNFNATSTFIGGGAGFILARPYFDLNAGAEDARILAFDNFNTGNAIVDLDGSIDVSTRSDFQSAGLTLRHVLWADFERNLRVDLLGGYRFLKVDESLLIRDRQLRPPVGLVGALLDERTDLFDTSNEFHGGEIGLDAQWFEDNWTFQLIGKCALGNMHEVMTIDGRTDVTVGGITATTPGGLLAQPSNMGEFSHDEFAVIPEGFARVQYSIYANVRVFAGYRVGYISQLLRPGNQVDRVINETQFNGAPLVGAARPAATFNHTSAWLHGMDAGIEFEW